MDIKMISIIAVGAITVISAAVAAISDSRVVSAALEGMARQPEAQGSLFRSMLVGIGLVEATPIIALVIAFILLFSNPLL
ncbi:MAG: ATP synthase F0 subunit C [Patescibacteria group bacterium]